MYETKKAQRPEKEEDTGDKEKKKQR